MAGVVVGWNFSGVRKSPVPTRVVNVGALDIVTNSPKLKRKFIFCSEHGPERAVVR